MVLHQTTARRWLRRTTTGVTTAGLVLVAVPVALHQDTPRAPRPQPAAGPQEAGTSVELVSHQARHPNRIIKKYRVRPGDTPSAIAVRYHAWTAELIRMNHGRTLYAGEVIRIPVVPSAQRACTKHKNHFTNYGRWRKPAGHTHAKPAKSSKPARPAKPKKATMPKPRPSSHASRWRGQDASRTQVRRVIVRAANRYGVDPNLALAIAWQESGWQQRRVSSAGAIGVMQILPSTGHWMSLHAGRRLHPHHLGDNVVAGVLLIRWLRSEASMKNAIAGYYQGLAGVERYGMYPSTKKYVANVLALKKRLAAGRPPV